MRKSDLPTKAEEGWSKNLPRLQYIVSHKSNRMWQAGGKAKFIYMPPGYNNDPCIKTENVHVKSRVIDLETYEYAIAA